MGAQILRTPRRLVRAAMAVLFGALPGAELHAALDHARHAARGRTDKSGLIATPQSITANIAGLVEGDLDGDGDVDWHEHAVFAACLSDSGPQIPATTECLGQDFSGDEDVDLFDWAVFARIFAPVPALPNSSCFLPATALDGTQPFTNVGATTDGPDEPGVCEYYGLTQVDSDVWFCYAATCTGEAVLSLCGSNYDTKMAVYEGCECPSVESAIACSDDDCGSAPQNLQSRVAVNVIAGQSYMIRIGGFAGQQGEGSLNITCGTGDPCTTSTSDCLSASPDESAGCSDTTCCRTTCAVDQFCCDVAWDPYCAAEAEGLCDGSFQVCETADTSCTFASLQPGCNDEACCNTVCRQDTYCCVVEWDVDCVNEAEGFCGLSCDSRAGSCFSAHASPGCDDMACCQQICPTDPFCCSTEWDANCAAAALKVCN